MDDGILAAHAVRVDRHVAAFYLLRLHKEDFVYSAYFRKKFLDEYE
jgi:hypothetical protein